MKHVCSIRAAMKMAWTKEPQSFSTTIEVDIERSVLVIGLPSETTLALDYNEMRQLIERVEAQHRGKKSDK